MSRDVSPCGVPQLNVPTNQEKGPQVKKIIATIKGTSRYSQSRPHGLSKENDESEDDFDLRAVREHLHYDVDGNVFISPATFKNCLDEAAKFLGIKKSGSEKYTKHFEAGVGVYDQIPLGISKDDVPFEKVFVDSNGRRGSGKRVYRRYPYIEAGYRVEVPFIILDETVLHTYAGNKHKTVFQHVLEMAGLLIGIGRFRPRNRGYYGRFIVEDIREFDLSAEGLEAAE
jgi:hypothetical protein